MHISEGVLSAPVLVGGALLGAAGVAAGLRKMDYGQIPKAAVLTSAVFVISLARIPLGPAGVHLALNGLMGIMLGWVAFPAFLVSLSLQALVFQFGGITTLGVNTLVMAGPAVAAGMLFSRKARSGAEKEAAVAGFLAGATGVVGGASLMALSLAASGEGFAGVIGLLLAGYLPVAVLEGFLSSSIVLFLRKVKSEMLEGT